MRLPDLSIFSGKEKIIYLAGTLLPPFRKSPAFRALWQEKAFYYNHRAFSPRRVAPGLFILTAEITGALSFSSYIRIDTSDPDAFRQALGYGSLFKGVSSPDPVFIDAGANIGLASLTLARLYPHATIYALEPDPENFSMLEKNIRLNHARQVIPLNKAIWTTTGRVKLGNGFRDGREWSRSLIGSRDAQNSVEVDSLSFPELFRTFSIEKVDLIKMDIEGAEFPLFDHPGSREYILRDCHWLIVEIHADAGDPSAIISRMTGAGFSMEQENEHFIFRKSKT